MLIIFGWVPESSAQLMCMKPLATGSVQEAAELRAAQ